MILESSQRIKNAIIKEEANINDGYHFTRNDKGQMTME